MRVRIVSYQPVDLWILGKFATKLAEEAAKLGVQVDIGSTSDASADINHHIISNYYDSSKSNIDTLMVTHVTSRPELSALSRSLEVADMGICVSRAMMEFCSAAGLPRRKLCYVNPATDGTIRPRRLLVGITTNAYGDGRKREYWLPAIAEHLSPADFSFAIMGEGWADVVRDLRQHGFTVAYYDRFSYEAYCQVLPTFDYYLYMGFDEGSMGFVDAVAAGIGTIVTAQGFHLDVPGGITHSFTSRDGLLKILRDIAEERARRASLVSGWTWPEYGRKHVEIWEYLLESQRAVSRGPVPRQVRALTADGISSIADNAARPSWRTRVMAYTDVLRAEFALRLRHGRKLRRVAAMHDNARAYWNRLRGRRNF